MKKDDVFEFYRRLAETDPAPETELQYVNPYTLLVAVALSAQATDVGVNKATRALFREVQTPQAMVELGEAGLKQHIKTIGLFNTKAKNVIALSEMLIRDFGGVTFMSFISTSSGSLPGAIPVRLPTRKTCVSTAIVSFPNATLSTTLAVLRPTPGSASSASRDRGTLPPCSATRRRDSSTTFFALPR